MLKVAVFGALGRMGREVVKAVLGDGQLELVAAVDTAAGEGAHLEAEGVTLPVSRSIDARGESPSVMVDFTVADEAVKNVAWALDNGVHSVIGTTGIPPEELESIASRADGGAANVLVAPNFALGAVMMMRFSREAAAVFDQCEIIELHHRGKKDAPSGTAIATARAVAEAMSASEVPVNREHEVEGTRGGRLGPVQIHSVRLHGLVAHQEVIFGSKGETLTLRHDTTDRSCFMPGVIMAVKRIDGFPGLTIGLEPLLDLD